MIKLITLWLLIGSVFTQQEGLSLAQQRVQQQILNSQPATFSQTPNQQSSFSQVFDLPQQPVILQDLLPVQEPVVIQDAFNNQQRRLTFQEQQQRRRLELESRQQQERIRQQQLAQQRAQARRRIEEQNRQRLQNQQQSFQGLQTQQQNVVANRRLQNPVAPQTVIRPVTQTLDDQRDGPFQDGTYYFRYATSDGIEREEGVRLTGPFTHEVTGSYSYIAPDGTLVAMEYIADENGYRAYPVRNNVVNPVIPPEPIPVPPPLRPVLDNTAPEINRPLPTFNRPTNVISPRPPLITQPIPDFTVPVQTVRPPIQTGRPIINRPSVQPTFRPTIQPTVRPNIQNIQRPFQTVRPVIQNVQTARPPIQRPFQTGRPLPTVQTFQQPIQNLTPRPILQPQVTPRPQTVGNFVGRPTVQSSSFTSFGNDNFGRRVFVDYDYGDLDYAASEPVLTLEPPGKVSEKE